MVQFILFLLLSLVATETHAGIILGGGPGFTAGWESEAKASNEKSLLSLDSSTGVVLDAELPLLGTYLTLVTTGALLTQKGNAQYIVDSNTLVPDVSVEAQSFLATIGGRFRFINFKKFKLYAGGGGVVGHVKLTYDKKDFTSSGGQENDFKEEENTSNWGIYLDLGTEYVLDKKSAVRASVRLFDTKTEKLDTLGSKATGVDYAMFVVQYLYYFDWKFNRLK